MEPNWKNRTLFHGDNLAFMRAMNSESVDLIATDPPFNKGKDFHATPDSLAAGARFQDRWSWDKDVHENWLGKIANGHSKLMEAIESARYAHSDGMGAFICFMAVRLLEMRRILKPTGSIYLHCDPTASHYLKACMDAIFGWNQFRNEIIWERDPPGKGAKRVSKQWPRNFDVLLYYVKSDTASFQQQYTELSEAQKKNYRYADTRGRYKAVQRGDYSDTSMDKFREQDKIHVSGKGKEYIKYYLHEARATVGGVWSDIYGFGTKTASKERTGFPTQKPLTLYERIIRSAAPPLGVVLDPFAGCATTLVAAERLKMQWVGIDIWDRAHEVVIERLRDEKLITPEGDHGGELFTAGHITYATELPERTDDGEDAAPFLRVRERIREPGRRMKKADMREYLLEQHGTQCQGCDRTFDDPRYLELDHNTPRSDGGMNHIRNRILLCSPCNRAKSNIYTLSGLRQLNNKNGWMAPRPTR